MKRWIQAVKLTTLLRCSTQRCFRASECCLAPRTLSPVSPVQCRSFSSPSNGFETCVTSILEKGIDGVRHEVAQKVRGISSEDSVRFFIQMMIQLKSSGGPVSINDLLLHMTTTATGLSDVIDMRAACARMIRALPEPNIILLDKILLEILVQVVTYDTTVVATVDSSSHSELRELVKTSDRVHPIHDDTLSHRLASNRRIYMMTHRLLPNRPLVILHVALSSGMFQCVSDILQGCHVPQERDTLCKPLETSAAAIVTDLVEDTGHTLEANEFTEQHLHKNVNTFYSISSLEVGLKGIPYGGWLVSKAKHILSCDGTVYTTLSPLPGFKHWLSVSIKRNKQSILQILGDNRAAISPLLASPNLQVPTHLQETFTRLAVYYLLVEKQRGNILDPVGHFHVGNGAVVWGLRWGGTRSKEMMSQSFGLMVNYLYDEDSGVRAQCYSSDKVVSVGLAVRRLQSEHVQVESE